MFRRPDAMRPLPPRTSGAGWPASVLQRGRRRRSAPVRRLDGRRRQAGSAVPHPGHAWRAGNGQEHRFACRPFPHRFRTRARPLRARVEQISRWLPCRFPRSRVRQPVRRPAVAIRCALPARDGRRTRQARSDSGRRRDRARPIRPVIVNGIDDIANRPDLAERCLVLTLQPIPKARRRDEQTFWSAFDAAAPRVLGVLLDGVASALRRLSEVQIPELPRMADFAKWIAAAEPGAGLPWGTLLAACERNRARVVDVALDASPVATAVRRLLDKPAQRGQWGRNICEQCFSALEPIVSEPTPRARVAQGRQGLVEHLAAQRHVPRSVGVTLDLDEPRPGCSQAPRLAPRGEWKDTGTTVPSDPTSPTAETSRMAGTRRAIVTVPATPPFAPGNIRAAFASSGFVGDGKVQRSFCDTIGSEKRMRLQSFRSLT